MTKHTTIIQPIDEAATNDFLSKSQPMIDARSNRGQSLQALYRSPTKLAHNQTVLPADQPLIVKWFAIMTLAFIMPLPFIALDLIFSALIGVDTHLGSTYVAMMGLLHVMVVGLVAFAMIAYARRVLDDLWLNTTFLLWTTVLFVLPIVTAARQWLVPEYSDGLWPPLMHSIVYSLIFIGASIGSLTLFTWLLYVYRKKPATKIQMIVAIVALPYIIAVPFIIRDIVRLLTFLQ